MLTCDEPSYAGGMPAPVIAAILALFGVGAIWLGAWVWRNALTVVTDARQQLTAMFGDSFPGLFESPPEPLGARIAGASFVAVGIAFVVIAVVLGLG